MNCQLVLQWSSGSKSDDLETLLETEELLIRLLPAGNEVDGHDIGSGEANIFILTNDPVRSFEQVKAVLESRWIWQGIRAAYREMSGDEYTVVWPKGLISFHVI